MIIWVYSISIYEMYGLPDLAYGLKAWKRVNVGNVVAADDRLRSIDNKDADTQQLDNLRHRKEPADKAGGDESPT